VFVQCEGPQILRLHLQCATTYTRLFCRAFFDKIAGIQGNGNAPGQIWSPAVVADLCIDVGSPEDGFDFDQIANFRQVPCCFARDHHQVSPAP